MRDDPAEALPPRDRSWRISVVEEHANTLRVLARLLDHFGRNIRSLFVCSALLLFASGAYGAGSYQRTRDGKALIWNASPKRDEEATWSGKRDKKGYAVGSGTLTWYKVVPTTETGSLIPNTRRAVVVKRYSGKMVRGKFKGAVTYVDASGRKRSVNLTPRSRQSTRKKATGAPTPAATVTSTAEQTSSPPGQQTAASRSELTPAAPSLEPAPEPSPWPGAQETPTAVPQQPVTLAREQTATRTSDQRARQPDAQSTIVPKPTPPDVSLRALAAPPSTLPKPPPALDAQTVAALDTVYQEAVKANDVAVMDRILADDFVLVTDRGASWTKADLIKEAREKRTIYEHQEEEEGTQKVRIWRDTAVVTSLLKLKGTRDQKPFDYKVSFSETYVRTPTGWRCVFGQASIPLPKPDAK